VEKGSTVGNKEVNLMANSVVQRLSHEQESVRAALQRSGHYAIVLVGCILGSAALYFAFLYIASGN